MTITVYYWFDGLDEAACDECGECLAQPSDMVQELGWVQCKRDDLLDRIFVIRDADNEERFVCEACADATTLAGAA